MYSVTVKGILIIWRLKFQNLKHDVDELSRIEK